MIIEADFPKLNLLLIILILLFFSVLSFFKVKSNTVKFIKYDIVKNPSLDDLIQNNTKTKYMWFSNCFKYEYGEDTDIQTCAYTQFIKTANDYNLFIDGKDVMLNNVHGIPKSG